MVSLSSNKKDTIKEIIINYYREHYEFPKLDHVAETASMTRAELTPILRSLEKDVFINRIHNQYYLTTETKKLIKKNHAIYKLSNISTLINAKLNVYVIRLIKTIAILVGIGCSYMSIFYTSEFLKESLSIGNALFLSLLMGVFSVVAFECVLIFRQRKKKGLSVTFILLWIIILFFSMGSTIAGQYNQRMAKIIHVTENTDNSIHLKYSRLITQENELISKIEVHNKELEPIQKILNGFNNETRVSQYEIWWNTDEQKKEIENKIKQAEDDLKNIREKIDSFLSSNKNSTEVSREKIVKKDFYTWVSGIFGYDPSLFQFIISVFPAVFIDIMAAVALALGLFLKETVKTSS